MAQVFISYRTADILLAERLATDIRRAGHEVWLDVWEIRIGDQIVEKMNQRLVGAAYVILCYSSAGMAPWITIEWTSTLTRQLNGDGVTLLPARQQFPLYPKAPIRPLSEGSPGAYFMPQESR